MKRIICRDYAAMSAEAARIVAGQIAEKPESVLGFATGSTPVGVYKELVRMYEAGAVDFSRVVAFNLDEYYPISRENAQSYYQFMRENLFARVNVDEAHCHIPDGEAVDAEAECARYDGQILEAGGIDLQILGVGHNGHVGFNEPSESLALGTNVVELSAETIVANARFFESADEVPRRAITMGLGGIFGARRILLLVSGEGKAEIVREIFGGRVSCRVPGSLLNLHADVTVILDEAAAGMLG